MQFIILCIPCHLPRGFYQHGTAVAENFKGRIEQTRLRQVISLSGIINDTELSKHLSSSKNVEALLSGASFSITTLKAGMVVGSGSASFEDHQASG